MTISISFIKDDSKDLDKRFFRLYSEVASSIKKFKRGKARQELLLSAIVALEAIKAKIGKAGEK